jgi:starch phosphorylase
VRLLSNPRRPVQLLLAGKAHPQDLPGQDLIRQWKDFLKRPEVQGRVVFLNDYDMMLAQELVQGIDLWINTPRRPWEACGTSGMKVLVNGGLNLSELDGWWAEAYSPEAGWAIDEDLHATGSAGMRSVGPLGTARNMATTRRGMPRRRKLCIPCWKPR